MSVSDGPAGAPASSWNSVRGDFFGGVAAGVVALPLALAFGVASGLGPVAGLYGAIATGIVAAVFGGTPVQITGPTGPMTLVMAGIVATNTLPSGAMNLPAIVAIVLLAGLLQIALGLFRIGGYIRYVPYPVISGFMSGIGVIIILQQLFPMLGVEPPSSEPLSILRQLHLLSGNIKWGRRYLIRLDHCDGLHPAAIYQSGSRLAGCSGGADGSGGIAGARSFGDRRHTVRAAEPRDPVARLSAVAVADGRRDPARVPWGDRLAADGARRR